MFYGFASTQRFKYSEQEKLFVQEGKERARVGTFGCQRRNSAFFFLKVVEKSRSKITLSLNASSNFISNYPNPIKTLN